MTIAIQPLKLSNTHKTCANLLSMYSTLTVNLIVAKFILMLLLKNTLRQYIQQMICYSILTYSAIDNRDNVISLSKMYQDILSSKRNMISFGDDCYKENYRQIKHAYMLILKFTHTFLVLHLSLLLVIVIILKIVPSLLWFHIILIICLNS